MKDYVHDGIQHVHRRRGAEIIHVETELGIVNIRLGLRDRLGRKVEAVTMRPDEFSGEPKVALRRNRFVQLKKKA